MATPVKSEKALTKKQLSDMMQELYKQLSIKQREMCDIHRPYGPTEEIFQQYNEIRTHISKAIRLLIMAGGIE